MAKQDVALKKEAPMPVSSELADKMAKYSGAGTSQAAEDNIIPLIYVLQSGSPQVKKGDPARIEGAEAGDFYLRNSANPIVKGEEGLEFQPVFFYKGWVEWMPDRGGFVTQHAEKPADAKADPSNPNKFIRDNGNEVVETRYHGGFVLNGGQAQPYILPLSSTGHAFSRQWMVTQNSKRLGNNIAPAWACIYKITTKVRQNQFGSWFSPVHADMGWVDDAAFDRGVALYEGFQSGAKRAADMKDDTGGGDSSGGKEIPF